MAESVLSGLATEAVKALAQVVAARASEQIDRSLGFKDHLRQIKSKLTDILAILEDVSKLDDAHKSEWLKRWVQRVKDVAYDSEDVMDEYAFEIFRRKMEFKDQCFNKLQDFFTLSNPLVFHYRMTQRVQKILSLFKELEEAAIAIGLTRQIIATIPMKSCNSYVDLRETRERAAANPSDFVGRVDDIEKLLEKICDPSIEQHHISTLAIIGMGGVGKTTLARCLYDNTKISDHFSKKLWIYVSQKFSIKQVLNDMIESLTSSNPGLSNEDAITRDLQQNLKGKKFLLVLDDVWNTNQESWDSLSESLRRIGGLQGSVILITTRENEVAGAARALFRHKLKQLSEEESWSLFERKVLIDRTSISRSKKKIGKRIVEKCSGIPLAIKVIGGLLQSKNHSHEWESIEKSNLWDLPQGQDQILPSLMLSFTHLPTPSLKQCFAYMSIFPKNEYLCKSELIGVWSSQGYLRAYNQRHRTPMDIGEDYLNMLLNSSLLQENEEQKHVYMHDLVYDLAVYISREGLIKEPKDHEEGSCRHLIFNRGEDETTLDFPAKEVLLKLRTIGLTGKNVPWDKLIQARYLRTLFLNKSNITELSSEIGSLKHLRYFDLSDNPIETLPDSFGKLYQLETLVLKECISLKMLPNVIYRLVNLRYIWTTTPLYACKGLAQLTHLEALPCLDLKANGEGWTIDELGKLDKLRDEIIIGGLEHVKDKEEARKAWLIGKPKVTKLTLTWTEARDSDGVSDEDILNSLEPHPNITSLKLVNFYGENLPLWILTMDVVSDRQRDDKMQLSNLTELKLVNCKRCRTLPALGQLPHLKDLVLDGFDVDCIGKQFYGDEDLTSPQGFGYGDEDLTSIEVSFPCLKNLEISNFQRLTTWMDPPQEAFTRLESLRISGCCLLESVVPALLVNYQMRKFEIFDCASLKKIPSSLEECTSLETLLIKMIPIIEGPPMHFSRLRRLFSLTVCCYSAEDLRSMLKSVQHLPALEILGIGGYKDEEEMSEYFSDITPYKYLQSLKSLSLFGSPNIKTLPQQPGLLTQIESLYIWDFEDLEEIPDSICNISSLEYLSFGGCKNLKCIPSRQILQRLPKLSVLQIINCPLLAERYAKHEGPGWHHISHIKFIFIDGEEIH